MAGIIAAQNNDRGLIDVSPDVELYSVKVLDNQGNGSVEDFVKGIKWAITRQKSPERYMIIHNDTDEGDPYLSLQGGTTPLTTSQGISVP